MAMSMGSGMGSGTQSMSSMMQLGLYHTGDPDGCVSPLVWSHFFFMSFACMFTFPGGVILVHIRAKPIYHILVQTVGTCFMYIAWFTIYQHKVLDGAHYVSPHGRFGLALFLFVNAQMILGILKRAIRNYKYGRTEAGLALAGNDPLLNILDALHRLNGYFILMMLFAQILLGLIMISQHCSPSLAPNGSMGTMTSMSTPTPTMNLTGASNNSSKSTNSMTMMGMSMGLIENSYSYNPVIFRGWNLSGVAPYIATLIFSVFISMFFDVLLLAPRRFYLRILGYSLDEIQHKVSPSDTTPMMRLESNAKLDVESSDTLNINLENSRSVKHPAQIRQYISKIMLAFFRTFHTFIGYLIMLLLMTYNTGVIVALLFGIFVSTIIFHSDPATYTAGHHQSTHTNLKSLQHVQ